MLPPPLPEYLLKDASVPRGVSAPADLAPFLALTPSCDHETASIRAIAHRLAEDADTDEEFARRAFLFARDEIACGWELRAEPASTTLLERVGASAQKANVLVALLRAAGLPAGFQVAFVRPREAWGAVYTRRFQRLAPQRWLHVFAAAWLGERWVRCDPTVDRALSDSLGALNLPSRAVEFDGARDAMPPLPLSAVEHYDASAWPALDAELATAPRLAPAALPVFERYLDFCRRFGRQYTSPQAVSDGFFAWHARYHPDAQRAFEALEATLGEGAS